MLGVRQAQLGCRAPFYVQSSQMRFGRFGRTPSVLAAHLPALVFCLTQQVWPLILIHESIMPVRTVTWCQSLHWPGCAGVSWLASRSATGYRCPVLACG